MSGSEPDREFDAETVPQGHAIEETVTVENRSAERRSVTLSSGDGSEATADGSDQRDSADGAAADEAADEEEDDDQAGLTDFM